MSDYNYFLSFFSSAFVAGFSSVLLSGLIIPFTVSPIGNLSNTPRLGAEAEGKKRSLLAEAEGFEAMVRAAESNPAIAIQYKMVDQWKEIAGEQVKAFEHMNLGSCLYLRFLRRIQ